MNERDSNSSGTGGNARRRDVVGGLVYVFEQVMPDPFVLAIGLTLVVALLAVAFAPHASVPVILTSWYGGAFNILGFALQMILILATGYAIADAPLVQRGLRAMAAGVHTPTRAALLVFPIVAVAAWLNWGLGLVVGALLSREIARRVKVDFAWLVAGSYSAWSVCLFPAPADTGLFRGRLFSPQRSACMLRFRAPPWVSPWPKTSQTCCNLSGRYPSLLSLAFASSESWATRRSRLSYRLSSMQWRSG
jgi:hypothetical protein